MTCFLSRITKIVLGIFKRLHRVCVWPKSARSKELWKNVGRSLVEFMIYIFNIFNIKSYSNFRSLNNSNNIDLTLIFFLNKQKKVNKQGAANHFGNILDKITKQPAFKSIYDILIVEIAL